MNAYSYNPAMAAYGYGPPAHSQDVFTDLIRKHALIADSLTEAQLAEAIRQALACGDFERQVMASGNSQSVVYIPFRRENVLRKQIECLKTALSVIGIDPDEIIAESRNHL